MSQERRLREHAPGAIVARMAAACVILLGFSSLARGAEGPQADPAGPALEPQRTDSLVLVGDVGPGALRTAFYVPGLSLARMLKDLPGRRPGPAGMPQAPAADNTGGYTVRWAPSDGGRVGVETYELQRKDGDGDFRTVAKARGTSYGDSNVPEGLYAYRVRAIDPYGAAGRFSPASKPVRVDKTPPIITARPGSAGSLSFTCKEEGPLAAGVASCGLDASGGIFARDAAGNQSFFPLPGRELHAQQVFLAAASHPHAVEVVCFAGQGACLLAGTALEEPRPTGEHAGLTTFKTARTRAATLLQDGRASLGGWPLSGSWPHYDRPRHLPASARQDSSTHASNVSEEAALPHPGPEAHGSGTSVWRAAAAPWRARDPGARLKARAPPPAPSAGAVAAFRLPPISRRLVRLTESRHIPQYQASWRAL
ncbi:MAG: fibronectin type III domain-containing protein [Elusimicrobiota bacterium]